MRVYSWSWGVCDWRRSPAFIKNYLELFGEKQECALNSAGEADCIDELSSQLMIIFLTRLVVGNTTEALVPWAKFWWKRRQEAKLAAQEHRDNLKKSPAELQNDLMDYDTFDDCECGGSVPRVNGWHASGSLRGCQTPSTSSSSVT